MARIVARNLSYHFGSRRVFQNLSLDIRDGEILGLAGPSGCGKTTVARILAGLLTSESGEIRFDDQLIFSKDKHQNLPPERRGIGMVFQDYAVWPHKSVAKNVDYPLQRQKMGKELRRQKIAGALEQVRMEGYADHMPVQLSGGQQQRVAIARALVSSEDFLILDEPITNLDAKLREEMIDELRKIQSELGTTVLYITHDQETALKLCDRLAIMNRDGDIVQVGSDEEIIRRAADRFVYEFIGVSNFLSLRRKEDAFFLRIPHADGGTEDCFYADAESLKEELETLPPAEAKKSEFDLAFRPLDLRFDETSPLKAQILRRTFLGSQYSYFVRVGSKELRMQVNALDALGATLPVEGEEVGLRILEARLFPAEAKHGGREEGKES